MPLVSFIITYYNLPIDMLLECIDSIVSLSLNRQEREIIVVDDGSAYSPFNDLAKYADDVVYLRKPNGGLSDARNAGLKLANGKYIQFVDGDDRLSRTAYEHCLDTVRFKQPDMVLFNFSHTESGVSNYADMDEPVSGAEYMKQRNLRATAWGYIFRREILGSLRFTKGIYHEDEEFTPQLLLRAERVFATEARAYIYRKREGSITNDSNVRTVLKRLDDTLGVIVRLQNLADTLPTTDSWALRRRVAQLTMDYVYNVMVMTRSVDYVEKRIDELTRRGLFPLPDRPYTRKYQLFRRMTMTATRRKLLIRTLPLLRKFQ